MTKRLKIKNSKIEYVLLNHDVQDVTFFLPFLDFAEANLRQSKRLNLAKT